MKRWRGLVPILLLAAIVCAQPAWKNAGPDLGALKQQFNQDAASPRVLMLVAPT